MACCPISASIDHASSLSLARLLAFFFFFLSETAPQIYSSPSSPPSPPNSTRRSRLTASPVHTALDHGNGPAARARERARARQRLCAFPLDRSESLSLPAVASIVRLSWLRLRPAARHANGPVVCHHRPASVLIAALDYAPPHMAQHAGYPYAVSRVGPALCNGTPLGLAPCAGPAAS